ncbi:MAG: ATP-binding protein [Gemmatimonadaceae bacterium]|nr:ATP-binding protein [Gemmatimonadaceae bacterium]
MLRWPSSLRVRLGLWHSMLLGVPLVVFALVCYFAFAQALIGGTDRFVAEALAAFRRELSAERRAGLPTELAMITTVREVRFREMHIVVLAPDGRVVAIAATTDSAGVRQQQTRDDEQLVAALRARRVEDGALTSTLEASGGATRLRAEPLVVDGQLYTLAARYPLREAEQTMDGIRQMFAVAIPLLILAAAASGYFLARRSLAPVASMAEQAAEISALNLHERMPVSGGDELVRLATVINALLDRLEQSFEQQRRFMADASHELRTPTAIVRTEADVTLSLPHRTEGDYRESVGIMQDAARRLTRIVDDLFLLARSDAGHLVVHKAPLHLEDVVDEAIRGVRPLAAQRGVRVDLAHAVESPMLGDADMLGRLVLNLLDNAIKHSPERGVVTVSMTSEPGGVRVSVSDEGPGIPPEARERVFERFFRVDASRTRKAPSQTSGAGLGLAIARRIAEAHDGSLALAESRPGLTVFEFRLPVAATLTVAQRIPILARS